MITIENGGLWPLFSRGRFMRGGRLSFFCRFDDLVLCDSKYSDDS